MSFFPADMPRPEPNWDDEEFWRSCAKEKLVFQACAECNTLRHPPGPTCPACLSIRVRWVDGPSTAVVYTFTVIHHPNHPAVESVVPYVVAVVEFPKLPGIRFVTNITDVAPDAVRIGMPVELWWDDIGDDMKIPRFRPSKHGTAA